GHGGVGHLIGGYDLCRGQSGSVAEIAAKQRESGLSGAIGQHGIGMIDVGLELKGLAGLKIGGVEGDDGAAVERDRSVAGEPGGYVAAAVIADRLEALRTEASRGRIEGEASGGTQINRDGL